MNKSKGVAVVAQSSIDKLLQFVRLVAAGVRPDGTYNRCREALEKEAKALLKELGSEE